MLVDEELIVQAGGPGLQEIVTFVDGECCQGLVAALNRIALCWSWRDPVDGP